MINIDVNKCTACGLCIEICHEHCITLIEEKIHIDHVYCSTCTQCIAICPYLALSWNEIPPEPNKKEHLPSSKQLDELFKQRRTIRFFKKEKPPRSLIEEIIGYTVYAPTHNFSFRAIVVDEQDQLNQIDGEVFNYNRRIYKFLYKPRIIHTIIKHLTPKYESEYLKAKPKLENSMSINRAYYHIPPVIVFLVGNKRIPLSLESAQYALYNMDLYARTKGLGGRILVGNQMFFNKSKRIRSLLKMEKDEKIFATIGLGFPLKKFRNKVLGRKIDILWTGSEKIQRTSEVSHPQD